LQGIDENIAEDDNRTENLKPDLKPVRKKRKIFRKIFYTFILLFLISAVLLQLPFVRNYILHFAVDKVNEKLAGRDSRLYVESIEGNILKHPKINGISLVVKNDTMFKIGYVEVEFGLASLFNKKVKVKNLILDNPQINFTKVRDKNDSLVWNLEYLIRPDVPKEEDTSKSEFDWKIYADNVEIRNLAFRSLAFKNSDLPIRMIQMKQIPSIDVDNLDIYDFNLKLSASYLPDEKNVSIKNLSFRTNSYLNLNRLSLDAKIDGKDMASVQNLKLLTDKSNIDIYYASMDDLNPLKAKVDYYDFRKKNFNVSLMVDKFDFDDLKFFLPDLDFLDDKVYLKLDAKGNYSDFYLSKLEFRLPTGSYFDIGGRVKNLHEPDKLYLDVFCNNAEIQTVDNLKIIPGLPVPDYSQLGTVYMSFKFKGEPLKFEAEANVRSVAGNAEVKGSLDITQNELVYDGTARTENIDIGKIVRDPKLNSSITGEFTAKGRGFDYRTLTANVDYKLSGSNIFGQRINNSSGKISGNNGAYDLDVEYSSNSGFAKIAGKVNVRELENMQYDLRGECRDVNLATITEIQADKSSLNFAFNANGSGISPDRILGTFNFDFGNSSYGDLLIPANKLAATFSQDTVRKININSDFLEMNVSGKFSILEIPQLIAGNVESVMEKIRISFMPDSLGTTSETRLTDVKAVNKFRSEAETNLRYRINIKSLIPLYLIMKDSSLVFKCDIRGRVINNSNNFVFSTEGRFSDFRYGDTTLMFNSGRVRFSVKDDYTSGLPFAYTTDIRSRFSDLNFGGTNFDTIDVDLNTNVGKPVITLLVKLDSTKGMYASGNMNIAVSEIGVKFDTLNFFYNNYNFRNSEPVMLSYAVFDTGDAKNHMNIVSFRLADGDQKITAEGQYSFNGISNITIKTDKVSIAKFQKFLKPRVQKEDLINGNIRRMVLQYSGTLQDPKLNFETNTDFLALDKMKLGRVDAIITYGDNVLVPQIAFYNPNNAGILTVNGILPLINPLKGEKTEEEKRSFLENGVNLKIAAENFQIKILQQFIPVISQLKGQMNGNLDITGIVKTPELNGNFNIDKGSFAFDMTGVNYDFDALMTTDNQKLNFQKFRITHKSAPGKVMNMGGYLDFSKLTINEIYLVLNGDAKLLDNQVTHNIMGVYGDLYGRTGIKNIELKGNLDYLSLNGDLDVTDGKILIIPQSKVAYNIYSDNFKYNVLIDSSTIKDSMFVQKMMDSVSYMDKKKLDPFQMYFFNLLDSADNKQKANNFRYFLKVKTLKDIYAQLIIDEKTKQEFSGYVSADLTIDNYASESFSTRGRVELVKNAYYKFYKNFKATGNVLFTGDLVNPELFIDGVYETTVPDPNNTGRTRNVVINLNVTGNASNPKLGWEITSNRNPIGGADPTDDAISFIVFGMFKDELNANQRSSLFSSVGGNVGTSFMSSYVSDIINTYLPFILKTDISYKDSHDGTFAENTDIRFTAQVAGATVIFGGQILQDLSNTNFLIEYPVSNLVKKKNFTENIIIQLERYVDPFSQNNIYSADNRTGGAILYRIKF
jgi:hypothetical protein